MSSSTVKNRTNIEYIAQKNKLRTAGTANSFKTDNKDTELWLASAF